MRYLSLFSGIEAASVAWLPLGWECVAVSEIEPLPCAVLKHHYPDVPNLGDVTKITKQQIAGLGHIDLVVFGSPCQDLSIAGKRAGLEGGRSGLFFDAMRIVRWAGARFALWENVPGAFSSNGGLDFASVVREMAGVELDVPDGGWQNTGVALGRDGLLEWSVLDAQWFGVPQRRRRIFALRDIGNWRDRPPVLLEQYGLQGNTPPRREAGQGFTHGVAPSLTGSGRGVERAGESRGQDPVIAVAEAFGGGNTGGAIDVATCLTHHGIRQDFDSETFVTAPMLPIGIDEEQNAVVDGFGCLKARERGGGFEGSVAFVQGPAIAFTERGRDQGRTLDAQEDVAYCLTNPGAGGRTQDRQVMTPTMAVRRLTPIECERLQGFPDTYTAVPYRGKLAADGPRYKALGNSMNTDTMQWIGRQVDAAMKASGAAS